MFHASIIRYTEGLDHEKPNVALNSNAAMASIKMGCYVQAIEHAEQGAATVIDQG